MKKKLISRFFALFSAAMLFSLPLLAQESDSTTSTTTETTEQTDEGSTGNQVQRPAFESNYVINTETVSLPQAKTLEFIIEHRFGKLNSGTFDMFGLYAPSNIRIGLSYAITDRIQLGIGSTKNNKLQDINYKVALLRQTKTNSIPVSVTWAGNVAVDVREDIFPKFMDRLSYYNSLIIGRRFSSAFSAQVSATYSHVNILDSAAYHGLNHSNIGVGLCARYKFSPQSAVLFEYATPVTTPKDIKPNIGLGVEIATSGHAFQIFLTTYDAIIPQQDYTFNKNNFLKKDILLGFNITRLWGF